MPTISSSSPTLTMPRSTRPGHHRAAARDREHVLDRQQERLVDRTRRRRDIAVDRRHQFADRVLADLLVLVLQGGNRRTLDHRDVVARILVLRQKLAHLELDQLEQLGVVDQVDLVQKHHQRRHADLTGQQDVLAGLRHRAVGSRDDQDRAVHLGGAGDHVLHIVGVARAVDMRIVAVGRLIFDMRRRNRDAARLLLRRRVDRIIRPVLAKILRDRRRQRRLAMVNVTNRANVHMRLVALEFTFCHRLFPWAADAGFWRLRGD